MKILMVAPTPFFADRGCHVRILGEIQGLLGLGHEVVVCTYPLGRDMPGLRVARTWPVPWYRKLSAGPSWHKYYIDLMLLALTRRWIRRWRPDVVHAHLHEGACIAAWALGRRRIPLIFDYQGSLTGEILAHRFTSSGSLQHRWMRRMERWIDRRADAVVTSTGAARGVLTAEFHVPDERIEVITDGVDPQQFQPGSDGLAIRQRYGIPAERPLLVYTGLLNAYQGIDLLLQALQRLAQRGVDFHALVVGYPDVERYRAQAASLGLAGRVSFPGRVPFEAMAEVLAAADIGVSAKLPGSEGNIKLYTYMAAGLPTVTFDTPMNREIVAETGVLVGRVDAEGFAEGLAGLLAAPSRWPEMGASARRRAVDEFSWRSVAERLVRVYERCTTGACA